MSRTLILGIGNVLLSDEGAGVHAVRRLAQRLLKREDVRVMDGGTLSFTLVPFIAAVERLIIIDASELARSPGSVQCFYNDEVDRFLGKQRHLSVHEVGLRDVMDGVRLSAAVPRERALIGIQPESLTWGTEPSPRVAEGIEVAVQLAEQLLEAWPVAARRGEIS